MTELTRLPNTTTVDEIVEVVKRDGGVIIEDFASPETLAGLQRDLLPKLAQKSTAHEDEFAGLRTRRLGRVFEHTKHMADVLLNPLFLKTAERFICTPVETWVGNEKLIVGPELRIGATQAIQIGPGEGAQPLHRDDMAFLWRHPQYGREARCQIMIAVSDFTAENGGTLVIPGSNHWDDDRQPKLEEAISTEMKAGSGLIWIGSTYHGGGNNRTDTPRTGVTVTLDASNLRQEENMYLSLSPETVKSYPEQIQRLLGWSSGKNYMGWVEIDGQMADPILLLENV